MAQREEDETMSVLVTKRSGRRGGPCASVQGITKRPQKLTVCVASPGDGKTRLGALCAYGRKTCVVCVAGTVRHWEREAGMVGVRSVLVGSGGIKAGDLRKKVEEECHDGLMWIVTRGVLQNYLKSSSAARNIGLFPEPDLLIMDEFHNLPGNAKDLLSTWPEAVTLGLTGTFEGDAVRNVAKDIGWDGDVLEAVTVRVPPLAIRGAFPRVQVRVKRVAMSGLEMACYEAGRGWMSSADRQRLLIFAPSREDTEGSDQYGVDVWRTVVLQLQKAEQEVHERLAKIITHVLVESRREALLATIADEVGAEAKDKIRHASLRLPPALAGWGPGDVERHVQEAFSRRKAILGGYVYLVRQLDSVSAGSEIECPVCLEKSRQWSIAKCGHLVCNECARRQELASRCPTCRAPQPCWKTAAQLAAMRKAASEPPCDDAILPETLDTSNKLKALAGVLLDLKHSERALIICPTHLLKAVAAEMRGVNINLGIMAGGGAEQERVLAIWTRGKEYKGLLAPPGIMGIDVHASTIIFLTDLMGETDFRQALARVKRQGNPAVRKGEPITCWFLTCQDTEEDTDHNLALKIRIAEEDSNGAAASVQIA